MERLSVVGGGVIGCLTALQLLERGYAVSLFDKGLTGKESSWAGGGIVSPLYPWRYAEPVSALAEASQVAYPLLNSRLFEATGIDPEFTPCGLLWLDHSEQKTALEWACAHAKPIVEVDQHFIYRQVPQLRQGYSRALWQADLANVRNPRLMRALRARLLQFPHFQLHEQSPVDGLLIEQGRVCGVRCGDARIPSGAVVLAAGAWSGDWLAELGLALPVKPVKGQMLLYRRAPGWLPSMVLFDGRYAIPRRDGHILIGSTLEHAGFDYSTTDAALASLRASAEALLPDLADNQPVAQWAGLRPGSPDGVPFIGAVPGYDGLWLNAGHYRNGLVLAPASCALLADLISGSKPLIDPAAYNPAGRLQAL
ncbi:MAG: glycine oxidase ThiO [Gammaproteobacteria bacterium HGW-Gammaproteobacteria-11]|nr:MAG: glycine oxidase ThiO [Gammaproteobacteria bacterium HGW-Gammaproteobacteria-11]